MKAVLTGQILIRKGRIWTARLRIDHVVIFQASAPRISSAAAGLAAAIASVAAADLAVVDLVAVIASVAAADLEDSAVIASEVAAVVALAASAAAAVGLEAGGKN